MKIDVDTPARTWPLNLGFGVLVISALTFFCWRADRLAGTASATFDEAAHLYAGFSYWRSADFRLNSEHPPLLKLLWAIPAALRSELEFAPRDDWWQAREQWRLGETFLYDSPVAPALLLLEARRVNIALAVLLIALVALWAGRTWGPCAGALALTLAAVDPNLAAYAALLSMDLGLALFATALCALLAEQARAPARWKFALAGVALGAAAASKFSALAVAAALLPTIAIWSTLEGRARATPLRTTTSIASTRLVRLLLIAAVVVSVSYLVVHTADWPAGLKQQLVRDDADRFYLDGIISAHGWLRYFPEAIALKTPPLTLLLLLGSLVALRQGRRWTLLDATFVLLPAGLFLIAAMASGIDLGWRIILPAYPALIVAASRCATLGQVQAAAVTPRGRWLAAAVPALLLGGCLVSALDARHGPVELGYSDPLLVDRGRLQRHLGDANVDWGQGLGALHQFLQARGDPAIYLSYFGNARPAAHGIRSVELPGYGQWQRGPAAAIDPLQPILVAVSVTNLQGIYLAEPETYRFLDQRPPLSRLDGSIWIWDVSADVETRLRVQELAQPVTPTF